MDDQSIETPNNTNNINNHTLYLNNINITTHNVQGLNDKLKLQLWLEYCNENNYHIISMTETKLAESTSSNFSLRNPYYYIYISNCDQKT